VIITARNGAPLIVWQSEQLQMVVVSGITESYPQDYGPVTTLQKPAEIHYERYRARSAKLDHVTPGGGCAYRPSDQGWLARLPTAGLSPPRYGS